MSSFEPVSEETERIAKTEIQGAIRVHSRLGPGLLESVYEICLVHELRKRGLEVETQVVVPVTYDEVEIPIAFRLDILVERQLIVEVKAVDKMNPVFEGQMLTYLRLTNLRLGLLINFNVRLLKDGLRRIIR